MDPKEVKKDLLPYILVVCGPKRDKKIRLMATDVSKSGLICKWAVANLDTLWVADAVLVFKDLVDPETLETLVSLSESVVAHLKEGKGPVWISQGSLDVAVA